MKNTNSDKKSQVRTLVIYGIILFMGALIVLAMAIVSQIKVDQSERDYQEQINNVINKYATQQEEAGQTISSLEDSLENIRNYLDEKQQALDDLKLDSQEAQNMIQATMGELSSMANLFILYINEDYEDCLAQIDQVETGSENALYAVLEEACRGKIAENLYNEGVRLFAREQYKLAIAKFEDVSDYVSRGEIYDSSLCLMLLSCDAAGEIDAFRVLCNFIAEEKAELLLDEKLDDIQDKIQDALEVEVSPETSSEKTIQ